MLTQPIWLAKLSLSLAQLSPILFSSYSYREVANDTVGDKLIFSSMGDLLYPAHGCWSYRGKVGSVGGENGQIINLTFKCLNLEKVIHEMMHSLGNYYNYYT